MTSLSSILVSFFLLSLSLSICRGAVLVLGATGRTGSLLYRELKDRGIDNVRGLVRNTTKAREVLHCTSCNQDEGIYLGDITNGTSLGSAFRGVHTVAIATGVSGRGQESWDQIKAIEFVGVQNAVRALVQDANRERFGGIHNLRVVLCSSQGTTEAFNDTFGTILHYKLNAEAFLGSVGIPTSVVKPCGLVDAAGRNSTLLALHDDARTPTGSRVIPRADVARVMAELVIRQPTENLRFDLCSIEGPATTDLGELIDSAKWSWQQGDDMALDK